MGKPGGHALSGPGRFLQQAPVECVLRAPDRRRTGGTGRKQECVHGVSQLEQEPGQTRVPQGKERGWQRRNARYAAGEPKD